MLIKRAKYARKLPPSSPVRFELLHNLRGSESRVTRKYQAARAAGCRMLTHSGPIVAAKSRSAVLLAKRGVLSSRSEREAQPSPASIGDLATRLIE